MKCSQGLNSFFLRTVHVKTCFYAISFNIELLSSIFFSLSKTIAHTTSSVQQIIKPNATGFYSLSVLIINLLHTWKCTNLMSFPDKKKCYCSNKSPLKHLCHLTEKDIKNNVCLSGFKCHNLLHSKMFRKSTHKHRAIDNS